MKKVLVSVLALVMLFTSLSVLAEGNEAVTLEVNTARLTVYAADDANAAAFRTGENAENTLPVLLLPVPSLVPAAGRFPQPVLPVQLQRFPQVLLPERFLPEFLLPLLQQILLFEQRQVPFQQLSQMSARQVLCRSYCSISL